MAFATTKLTELPLRTSLPFSSYAHSSSFSLLFSQKHSIRFLKPFSGIRSGKNLNSGGYFCSCNNQAGESQTSGGRSPLHALPSSSRPSETVKDVANQSDGRSGIETRSRFSSKEKGQNAIDRIVLRLRNLGLGSDDEEEDEEEEIEIESSDAGTVTGEERLGDLLKREWIRPDTMIIGREKEKEREEGLLPWQREEKDVKEVESSEGKKKSLRAPSLAELTIEDEELRRLRRNGMYLRERVNVPKAGITEAVLEKIHDRWRKEELVRLKFHEFLACDMKTAHRIVEVFLFDFFR